MGGGILGRVEVTVKAIIRPCVEDDLPALEWMGLYTPHRHIIRQAFAAQQRGEALLLLGVASDFPIAQVWIDFARKRSQGIAVLWAVRTFFPLQRAGIGRRIMTAAESTLYARDIRRAELEVEPENRDALRFYQKLGWRLSGYSGAADEQTGIRAYGMPPGLLRFAKDFQAPSAPANRATVPSRDRGSAGSR